MALAAGLNVPDFEEVEVGQLPGHVKYPIITKAVDSLEAGWKSLTHICHNERELIEAYKQMKCKIILLQHYVEKENETGFNGFSINHGQDVYLPLQLAYFSTEPDTFGNYIYLFRPDDTDLVEKVKRLIKSTGYEGGFSVDLLIGKDGKIYFLEINFRNSAWSYSYTCAGVNLPCLWAKSMLSGKLETGDVNIKKLPFTSIVDIWEITSKMRKGIIPGLKAIWSNLTADSHIFWDWHDQKPFWSLINRYLGVIFHR